MNFYSSCCFYLMLHNAMAILPCYLLAWNILMGMQETSYHRHTLTSLSRNPTNKHFLKLMAHPCESLTEIYFYCTMWMSIQKRYDAWIIVEDQYILVLIQHCATLLLSFSDHLTPNYMQICCEVLPCLSMGCWKSKDGANSLLLAVMAC